MMEWILVLKLWEEQPDIDRLHILVKKPPPSTGK